MNNDFSNIINNILNQYGLTILCNGSKMCAIANDLAPMYKTELKVLHRLNHENILEELYYLKIEKNSNDISRII